MSFPCAHPSAWLNIMGTYFGVSWTEEPKVGYLDFHPFYKCLLSTCSVSGVMPGLRDRVLNTVDMPSIFVELKGPSGVEELVHKQAN